MINLTNTIKFDKIFNTGITGLDPAFFAVYILNLYKQKNENILIVVNSLYLINILFGTVQGTFGEDGKFDLKKFLFGFLKEIIASLGIFALCYVLNLFALVLELTNDITISTDIITTAEVIIILVT